MNIFFGKRLSSVRTYHMTLIMPVTKPVVKFGQNNRISKVLRR